MEFIGRKRELRALDLFLQSPEAGLLILFGRRRVGKTRLLTHFMESRGVAGGLYWMATTQHGASQLRDFSQALFRYDPRFASPPSPEFTFPGWEAAFQNLADAAAQFPGPQLVVLDEFTYLVRNDPALPSLFQRAWDHRLSRQANLKLVLTGSLVGMMEREVIASNAPLYGRATALLRLRPLPYAALLELFPGRTAEERVAIFAVTGGVPAYVSLFTQAPTFVRALHERCLVPGSIMLGDPPVMLHEQLKEPQVFESVLAAIASGFHKWGEIARMGGISETSLGHYLGVLEELELIERSDPILAPAENRRGQYFLRDRFLHFYYRFIVPHLAKIDRGLLDVAVDQIYTELRAFIGTYVFEELCREWALVAGALGELDFEPEAVGSYWQPARGQGSRTPGVQLDVVAASRRQRRLLIGEAKWGREPVSRSILTGLVQRSQRMPQVGEGWQVQYVLFARQGFTAAARAAASELGVRLVSLAELESTLAKVEQ